MQNCVLSNYWTATENFEALKIYIDLDFFIPNKEIIREMPTGRGFADIVFQPLPHTGRPAIVVELKYNKDAESAIQQIKDKRYTQALEDYTGEIVLVGINYDKETKTHSCAIERVEKVS